MKAIRTESFHRRRIFAAVFFSLIFLLLFSPSGSGARELIKPESTYTIWADHGANGTISPCWLVSAPSGSTRTFTMTPDSGYTVSDVIVDGLSKGPLSRYTFEDIDSDHTISAFFTKKTYTITAFAVRAPSCPAPNTDLGDDALPRKRTRRTEEYGTISPSGYIEVEHGGRQTFYITSKNGYKLLDVQVDDYSKGPRRRITLSNVTGHRRIYAIFCKPRRTPTLTPYSFKARSGYGITAVAGFGGKIVPSGDVDVSAGDDKTFSILPDPGCILETLSVDGSPVEATPVYTFQNVSGDHAIEASFDCEGPFYVIKAEVGPGGLMSPSGEIRVKEGADVTFDIQPGEGYVIDDLKVDNESAEAGETFTFENVASDHTLEATFGSDPASPAESMPDIKANGSDGPLVVSSGEPISITLNLAPGSRDGVEADCWVVARTSLDAPFDLLFYTHPGQWSGEMARVFEAPLATVDNMEASSFNLPVGDYTFYFGVDDNADRSPDGTWFDSVEVHVIE